MERASTPHYSSNWDWNQLFLNISVICYLKILINCYTILYREIFSILLSCCFCRSRSFIQYLMFVTLGLNFWHAVFKHLSIRLKRSLILVLSKLEWKEKVSILETWTLTAYCVKTTQIAFMVWSQQMEVVLIVFRILKMWLEIGQKDVSNWKKTVSTNSLKSDSFRKTRLNILWHLVSPVNVYWFKNDSIFVHIWEKRQKY